MSKYQSIEMIERKLKFAIGEEEAKKIFIMMVAELERLTDEIESLKKKRK